MRVRSEAEKQESIEKCAARGCKDCLKTLGRKHPDDYLQMILDRHTSRKNYLTQGRGEACDCEDCNLIRKAMAEAISSPAKEGGM